MEFFTQIHSQVSIFSYLPSFSRNRGKTLIVRHFAFSGAKHTSFRLETLWGFMKGSLRAHLRKKSSIDIFSIFTFFVHLIRLNSVGLSRGDETDEEQNSSNWWNTLRCHRLRESFFCRLRSMLPPHQLPSSKLPKCQNYFGIYKPASLVSSGTREMHYNM